MFHGLTTGYFDPCEIRVRLWAKKTKRTCITMLTVREHAGR